MRLKRYLLPTAMLAVLALALVLAPDVLAQGKNFGLDVAAGKAGLSTDRTVPQVIGSLLRTLLGFVGTLFLILMVYAGFLYLTARGDSKKVDQAKQLITGAIIGVVIIASAYAITQLVLNAATGSGQETTAPADDAGDGPVTSPADVP